MRTLRRLYFASGLFLVAATAAQAGVLKVATFPLRHPVKTTVSVLKVATYPLRHPVKTVF